MILFNEIYEKAVNLFDDPDIHKAYVQDKVKFQKMMHSYFQNGIALFTNPMSIAFTLVDQTPDDGEMEILEGTGDRTYTLTHTPPEGSAFSCRIGGTPDPFAFYTADNNSITFSEEVPAGTECSVEWYFGGAFNTDFSSVATSRVPAAVISNYVKEILARALILAWAENEKNFVLEIRNLLTDTDFKMYSPANSVRAKVEWVRDLRFQFDNLQTRLGWMMFGQLRSGGQMYGP